MKWTYAIAANHHLVVGDNGSGLARILAIIVGAFQLRAFDDDEPANAIKARLTEIVRRISVSLAGTTTNHAVVVASDLPAAGGGGTADGRPEDPAAAAPPRMKPPSTSVPTLPSPSTGLFPGYCRACVLVVELHPFIRPRLFRSVTSIVCFS